MKTHRRTWFWGLSLLVVGLMELLVLWMLWYGMSRFDEGLAAYNRDDYDTALQIWRRLAEKGDTRAQHKLGLMYAKGQGIP